MSGSLPVFRRWADLQERLGAWRRQKDAIALVPTMGALHKGHGALFARAREERGTRVLATLFVNPLQFECREDLAHYPRTPERDLCFLGREGVDALFLPELREMYPSGFSLRVSLPAYGGFLCGKLRPGHMEGVATVMTRLLVGIRPDRAYFGEKDYQQMCMIEQLSKDLMCGCRIHRVATVREADGLACSSRNLRLSASERAIAPGLYRLLRSGAREMQRCPERPGPILQATDRALRDAGFGDVAYLDLRCGRTLRRLHEADATARLFAAVELGGVRLMDNVPVRTDARIER